MDNDLLKKVRKIEIKTRSLSHQIFAGEYHSAFKGRGMAFSQVREYQYGDDVRNMDWNVTARMRAPYIKVFEEERELTVMLLIDVSGSRLFGTRSKSKRELAAEIAAVLSFSASINNDKVGALFFSTSVEKFIPPKKGRIHLLRIIRELLEFEPENKGTDISSALIFLNNAIKKRCTAFLLSDLMDLDSSCAPRFEDALKLAVNRHDISVINLFDPADRQIPNVGVICMRDLENGGYITVDTSLLSVREQFSEWNRKGLESSLILLRRYKVDSVSVKTDDDYVKALVMLFNTKIK